MGLCLPCLIQRRPSLAVLWRPQLAQGATWEPVWGNLLASLEWQLEDKYGSIPAASVQAVRRGTGAVKSIAACLCCLQRG